jgi:hypothetical protein
MNSNGMKTLCLFIFLVWVAASATTPTSFATYDLTQGSASPTLTLIASGGDNYKFV